MDRIRISTDSTFEKEIGYSRAVVVGDTIYVSGTTGYDYDHMTISPDIVAQTRQCFENIKAALAKAGANLADIVRVTYILPDASLFELTWPVLREYLGDVRPAATMLSAGLANEDMLIEIEVTAVKTQ